MASTGPEAQASIKAQASIIIIIIIIIMHEA
jgi:hypothetical protein